MGAIPLDQYEPVIDGPEPAYADATGLFAGSELTGRIRGLGGWDNLDNELLEDPSYVVGGGGNEPIEGVEHNRIALSWSTAAEGIGGTGAGDGVTPTPGFVTRCLQTCLGSAGDIIDGDTVDAAATTTSIPQVTPGGHALSASDVGLAIVELDDGTYALAPFDYASPNLALRMALPSVPSAGNLLPGVITIPYAYRWTGNIGFSSGLRLVNDAGGADTDYQVRGLIGSFKVPQTGPEGVPQIDWSFQGSGVTRDLDLSAGEPAENPGVVLAGSDIALAAYGSTAVSRYCVKAVEFDLAAGYRWNQCLKRQNEDGVSGAVRTNDTPFIRMFVEPAAAPPAAIASGASKFRVSRKTKGDRYQVLMGLDSGGPGKIFGAYFPFAYLADVMPVTYGEELVGQVLEFRPKAGGTDPHLICVQG